MKIALVDIETLGLNPREHEIIEIAAIIFDSKTFQIYNIFESKINPFYPENADPKAIKCNGFTEDEWKDAPNIIPVLEKFIEKTKDCIFLAYNVSFDWGFLEYYLEKYGMKHQMSYSKMCLMSMAFGKIPHDKVWGWSLKTVATYLGVPREDKMHRAMGGVNCEFEVYKKLMQ